MFCPDPLDANPGKCDEAVEVWNHNERSLHVRWPVMIEYIDGDEPQRGGSLLRSRGAALRGNGAPDGLSRRMRVVPDWLGGVFEWETNHCCEITMSGFAFLWACGGDCGCGGCEAHGWYVYEGYRLDAFGGHCGCSYASPGGPEPEPGPSVGVSFSQKVLFYEDEYTNSVGVGIAPYCATNVVLTCVVNGGPHGGIMQLALNDGGRLEKVDGDDLPIGAVAVDPHETTEYHVTYESTTHSDAEDDITATVTFTENLSGDTLSDVDQMTVVMLTSIADAEWPDNKFRRHLGVGESIRIYKSPNVASTNISDRGVCENAPASIKYRAPSSSGADSVTVNSKGVVHTMSYYISEPSEYLLLAVRTNVFAVVGESGGFDMFFSCRITPIDVSFGNIDVVELPRVATDAEGYYAQKTNLWDHGTHGAGIWHRVHKGNQVYDTATMELNELPWLGGGSFTWPIPNAWRISEADSSTNIFCSTDQRFELDSDGTARLRKFGRIGERRVNGTYNEWDE